MQFTDDLLGAVLDDHAVEHGPDGLPVFGRQLPHRFKLQLEVVARPALVGVEDQGVGRDGQGDGQLADDFQRRLGVALLVALNLRQWAGARTPSSLPAT